MCRFWQKFLQIATATSAYSRTLLYLLLLLLGKLQKSDVYFGHKKSSFE